MIVIQIVIAHVDEVARLLQWINEKEIKSENVFV
jgi:hypothetical protein